MLVTISLGKLVFASIMVISGITITIGAMFAKLYEGEK